MKGVKLWLEQDRLRYRAPRGALTSVLRAEIADYKADIIAFLSQTIQSVTYEPIQSVLRDGALPLSFAQQRLWFLDQLGIGHTYNIPLAWRLSGSLNVEALQRTLTAIVQRHESLRTTFHTVQGQPRQVINPPASIPLLVIDLRQLSVDTQAAEVTRRSHAEMQRPFDLRHDIMLRALLLHLCRDEHILLLTLHHIAADGWSLGILLRELATLYRAFAHEQPSPLPALAIQYADFAAWQRQWAQGEAFTQHLTYWMQQL